MVHVKNFRAGTMLLLAGGALALSGCAATLQPGQGAELVGKGSATASAANVSIVTMTPDFPGMVDIEDAVTPMKIRLVNHGTQPVRIRYADFKLVDAGGGSYAALPLYKIDSSVETAVPVRGFAPVLRPNFRYDRFRVAPYYAGLYPGMPWFRGGFGYTNPYGWTYYDTAFADVQLPTPAMRKNVLPEGVLDPGGSLEGWLYFQHVSPKVKHVSFDATITSPEGTSLGDIAIPYDFKA